MKSLDDEVRRAIATAPTQNPRHLLRDPLRGELTMMGEPSVVVADPPIVGGEIPALPEAPEADPVPRVAPAEEIEGQTGPEEGRGLLVRHDGGRLQIDRVPRVPQLQAEVQALSAAQITRILQAELVEGLGPEQLAVEFDQLRGCATQLPVDLRHQAPRKPVLLEERPSPVRLEDVRLPARHVDEPARGLLVAIERPHRPGAGLVGALDEAVEPPPRDEHVIVDEAHVLRVHVRQREGACLHGRDVVLGADEREAALPSLELEIPADRRRRGAVDVDELMRQPGVGEDALERRSCHAELLARRHDHGGPDLGHDTLRWLAMSAADGHLTA